MSGFSFEIVDESTASEELSELRKGKGGRTSMYKPLEEAVIENCTNGEVLKTTLEKSKVQGFRGYMKRYHGKKYTVTSAKVDDTDEYKVFVTLTPKKEEETEDN